MAKTATLNVRIEPEVKAAAVKIFDEWGLSTSSAINMMLKSIVRNENARPDAFLPHRDGLVDITNMTDQEIVDMVNWQVKHSRPENYHPLSDLVEKYCKKA